MRLLLCLPFFLVLSLHSFAQISISEVSIKVGMVNNFQYYGLQDNIKTFAFSPGAEIGGKFLTSFIQWGINFSYWNDGIEEPLPIADYETISHTNYAFGFRLITTPNIFKFFLNTMDLSLVTGISYNILNGTNISLKTQPQKTDKFFQPYIGLQFSYKIINNFKILGESEFYINAGGNRQARVGFFVGGKYNFN